MKMFVFVGSAIDSSFCERLAETKVEKFIYRN